MKALKEEKRVKWKKDRGYHKRLVAETEMYRYKQFLSPTLTFRDYTTQVGEALVNMKAMNKIIRLSMPVRQQINEDC